MPILSSSTCTTCNNKLKTTFISEIFQYFRHFGNLFTVELRRELETSVEPFTEVYPKTGEKMVPDSMCYVSEAEEENSCICSILGSIHLDNRSSGGRSLSVSRQRPFFHFPATPFHLPNFSSDPLPSLHGCNCGEVKGLTAARAETFHPELTTLLCMGYQTAKEAKQPQCGSYSVLRKACARLLEKWRGQRHFNRPSNSGSFMIIYMYMEAREICL